VCRPPYGVDTSLERVYQLTNAAWTVAFKNSSDVKRWCAQEGILATLSSSSSSSGVPAAAAAAPRLVCPACIAKIRLVSISGGDIDVEVPAALTDLNQLFPVQRPPAPAVVGAGNASAAAGDSSYLGMIGTVLQQYLVSPLRAALGGAGNESSVAANDTAINASAALSSNTSGSGDAVSSNGVPEAIVQASAASASVAVAADGEVEALSVPSASSAPDTASPVSTSADAGAVLDDEPAVVPNSADKVAASVGGQEESGVASAAVPAAVAPIKKQSKPVGSGSVTGGQYVSLRTSQLSGVGFPIDHVAMVWCYDLLHVVTKGMKKLSQMRNPKAGTAVVEDWNAIFPVSRVYKNITTRVYATADNATLGGGDWFDKEVAYAKYVTSRRRWLAAEKLESAYIYDKLPTMGRRGAQLAFDFISLHFSKIFVCYLAVSALALLAPLLTALTGNVPGCASGAMLLVNNFDALLPRKHFSADLISAFLFQSVKASLPPTLWRQSFRTIARVGVVLFLVRVAFDYFFTVFDANSYWVYAYWVEAYFLALMVRAVVLLAVLLVRWVYQSIVYVLWVIARYTVWNQFIRRGVRGAAAAVHGFCCSYVPAYATASRLLRMLFVPLLAAAFGGAVVFTSKDRLQDMDVGDKALPLRIARMGIYAYALSVLTLVAYAVLALGTLLAVLHPPRCCDADSGSVRSKNGGKSHDRNKVKKTLKGPLAPFNGFYTEMLLFYWPAVVLALPAAEFSFSMLYKVHTTNHMLGVVGPLLSMFHVDRVWMLILISMVAAHIWLARGKR
jgi:hypothetical protein